MSGIGNQSAGGVNPGAENTFTELQTFYATRLAFPSDKGYPDTLTLRNLTDVEVTQYAPEHLITNASRPIVRSPHTKTASYTIPVSEAYNHSFNNVGATGSVTFTLPAAVIGMDIAFYVGAAQDLVIDPNGTDQIMIMTDTAGDTITANAVGEFVILRCLNTGTWNGVFGGTWTEE